MSALDRGKFAKVLALAESANDGEALAAIRMAAKLARGAGMSLGQAIEAPVARRIRDTERTGDRGWSEGYQAGLRAGAKEFKSALHKQVEQLEIELEKYRSEIPWPELAESYFSRNARGARKEFAKGLIYRARVNRLQPEDLAELRRWDAARQKKNRRAAA